jgi:hypothetical protein
LSKLNTNDTMVWTRLSPSSYSFRSTGGSSSRVFDPADDVVDLTVSSSFVAVLASTYHPAVSYSSLVLLFNAGDGSFIYAREFGGSDADYPMAIALSEACDTLFVSGTTSSPSLNGVSTANNQEIFLLAFRLSNGTLLWTDIKGTTTQNETVKDLALSSVYAPSPTAPPVSSLPLEVQNLVFTYGETSSASFHGATAANTAGNVYLLATYTNGTLLYSVSLGGLGTEIATSATV